MREEIASQKEKMQFVQWVKAHKKQLAIAGISIVTILALIGICVKNKERLKALWMTLKKAIKPANSEIADSISTAVTEIPSAANAILLSNDPAIPIHVKSHIRNLPEGQHPSIEKVVTAFQHGIILLDGQTWFEGYTKGCKTA